MPSLCLSRAAGLLDFQGRGSAQAQAFFQCCDPHVHPLSHLGRLSTCPRGPLSVCLHCWPWCVKSAPCSVLAAFPGPLGTSHPTQCSHRSYRDLFKNNNSHHVVLPTLLTTLPWLSFALKLEEKFLVWLTSHSHPPFSYQLLSWIPHHRALANAVCSPESTHTHPCVCLSLPPHTTFTSHFRVSVSHTPV